MAPGKAAHSPTNSSIRSDAKTSKSPARTRLGQPARIPEHRLHPVDGTRVPHVQRNRIDHPHPMPVGGQPAGMHPGAAADIEHGDRSVRQQPPQHILGTQELEPTGSGVQPLDLPAPVVVVPD